MNNIFDLNEMGYLYFEKASVTVGVYLPKAE